MQSSGVDHSHIRVIPHRGNSGNTEDKYDDGIPTFRSPSLQYASLLTPQTRIYENSTAESLSQVKTFADMARRYHKIDDKFDSEQLLSNPGPLGSILKLQSHRKTWQPMRTSDLSHCENAENDACEPSLEVHTSTHESGYNHIDLALPAKPSLHSQIQSMLDNSTATSQASDTFFGVTGDENHMKALHAIPGHSYERLFGKLPDLIRLHEQTGDFDGQVVFIGHPNRDVSAHQWSSNSFQWINIGKYAHVRGKVEGPLSSDCLRQYDVSHHPIEFFKCAAKNRERHVVENGRQDIITQSSMSASTYADRAAKTVPIDSYPSTPESSHNTITREQLEDPFIAHSKSLISGQTLLDRPKASKVKINGSLDFNYEFPSRANTSVTPGRTNTEHHGSSVPEHLLQKKLQEVTFGEDAGSYMGNNVGRLPTQQQTSKYASLHNVEEHCILEENVVKPDLPVSYARASIAGHVATLNVPNSYATARSLFPASGLTVANPRRTGLNVAKIKGSQSKMHAAIPESESSHSETAPISPVAVALMFSDPDGVKQSQDYEIANGFSKQAPTVQNLKGPFFTDTKPTTIDPTAQLSLHIGEEEKLSTWFHDGHRPARQQAYAKSLMLTAVSLGRVRDRGAVGETVDSEPFAEYRNTPAFVRLYENLLEYVDERRNCTESPYFARAWKKESQGPGIKCGSSYVDKSAPGQTRAEGRGGYQAARYGNRSRGCV